MAYTEFSREQILDDDDYINLCNIFLGLVTNDSDRKKLESVLYDGGYKNFGLVTNLGSKDNTYLERQRRISMANLLVKNSSAFDFLSNNNVNVFHGTNGNSLPSILCTGLNSFAESEREGINVTTGEEWSRMYNKRDYISFSDILDVTEKYASLTSREADLKLSFPVIIGTTVEEVKKSGICSVQSDVSEIGVKKKLPVNSIKVLLVPFDKVDFVKKMVQNNIKVFGIDYYYDKFYNLTDYGKIEVLEDKLMEYKKKSRKVNRISTNDIDIMAKSRLLSGIKKQLGKFKTLLKDEDNTYESGKTK